MMLEKEPYGCFFICLFLFLIRILFVNEGISEVFLQCYKNVYHRISYSGYLACKTVCIGDSDNLEFSLLLTIFKIFFFNSLFGEHTHEK